MSTTPERPRLENCADEPIRVPGSIQPHGLYLAVDDHWILRQVSANVSLHTEFSAEEILGKPLGVLFNDERSTALVEVLRQARKGYMNPLRMELRSGALFEAIVHTNAGLTVVELEPASTATLLDQDSTASVIDPYFNLVQAAFSEIRDAPSLAQACQGVCEAVRGFTEFDRVLFYEFDESNHGEVVAESVVEGLTPYMGLHFPESDIPAQARELYLHNPIRIIGNATYEPSPLVPANHPLTGEPTDLSEAVLRSVSPVHREYLRNMGVGASMSLSIIEGDRLWGLVSCHHRSPRHLPYSSRAACVMLSTVVSAQLASKRDAIASRAAVLGRSAISSILAESARDEDFSVSLDRTSDQIRSLFEADGMAFWLEGREVVAGTVPEEEDLVSLAIWLEQQRLDEIRFWNRLSSDYEVAEAFSSRVAGMLAIPFGYRSFLLLFRKPHSSVVRWAGDPDKAGTLVDGRIRPRRSFEEWRKVTQGQSKPWAQTTLTLATELRISLSLLIINRNRKLAELNEVLDAKNKEIEQLAYTISHDLRSPMVSAKGFLNFLEADLAAGKEDAWRDSLREVGLAIDQMGTVLDDLLEFSSLGRDGEQMSDIDLNELAAEVVRLHSLPAEELGAEITVDPELHNCCAKRRQLLRALDNLVGNALKYGVSNTTPKIRISSASSEGATRITVRDNGMGIEPAHHQRIFELFQRLDPTRPGTGLGLASVQRVAELHGGRVDLVSAPGQGSAFTIVLPNRTD